MTQAPHLDSDPFSAPQAPFLGSDPTQISDPWCVVKTRSRAERKLSEFLTSHLIDHYVPMTHAAKQRRPVPFIPGFVFLANTFPTPPVPASYLPPGVNSAQAQLTMSFSTTARIAKQSRLIINILHTLQQTRLRSEILALHTAPPGDARPETLLIGQLVQILPPHPLAGLTGHVARIPRRRTTASLRIMRITIHLQLLGLKISRSIPADALAPA